MSKQKRDIGTASTGSTEPWAGRSTIVGLFPDRPAAESAINDLKRAGFADDEIGVAMRDRTAQGQLVEDTGTQAAEGATKGAVGGGVVGGVLGLLGGIGALAIPGLGPIFAAGWLGSTLAGAGIGAAAGGMLGALVGAGVPEDEARHFDQGFKAGGILVTVRAGERAGEAVDVLRRHGADLGPSLGAGVETGYSRASESPRRGVEDEQRLQLREEELEIEKERVQAGEVRLRKEVITEERQIDVPVTREEVVIERRPVAGGDAEAGEIAAEGEEIRVPLSEERVRVNKRPVVKEEVAIAKQKVQDTQHVSESVRHEEARIENEVDTDVRLRSGGERERYSGTERRRRQDTSYRGRERRVGV